MEGYYIYHDRENKTISFAQTTCPPRIAGSAVSTVHSNNTSKLTKSQCTFVRETKKSALPSWAIVLISVFAFLLTISLALCVFKLIQKHRYNKARQLRTEIDIHDLMDDTFDTEY